MNQLDSELVAGALVAAGHQMVDDHRDADVALYNTCSVRRHAEQKVYSRLGAEGQRKGDHRPHLIVGVLGCMAQRQGESLRAKYPHVDVICSPGQLYRLADMIAEAVAGRPVVAMDPSRTGPPDSDAEAKMDRLDLGRDPHAAGKTARAYVRVMRGCDNFCSYCIVPFVRGGERSRNPEHILQEARRLVDAGRTEITLLGQTVNSYRWATGERTVRFSDLLERVSAVRGLRRLRFVTSHPVDFTDDILVAMRDLENVCPYMHCPAQSGSDVMLSRMNRRYTRGQYDDLVDRAREIVPGVVLAGDFIVGFPGETDEDHLASADLIRRSGYKNSFIFKYSPRPGTLAAKNFTDDVPEAVKRRRNNELLAVQAEVGLAHHRTYIGKTVEVLVEGPSRRWAKQPGKPASESKQMAGRTRGDHIVVFDAPETVAGQYLTAKVVGATSLTLFAELVS
jgi:tRNA-2-methylthio-N6-dimethylallyladenosine synthase